MRNILFTIALATSAGCLRQTAFHCDVDTDCGSGTCEVVGYCSFADSACEDGRRYGELSGPHAGRCVGETDMPDASVDSSGPDAEIDAPPNLDMDNDGVLNATDNCQNVANANQDNEDGDALGDVCDPCPPVADNTDGDGDGVGDRCDPNPATGGETIAVFEGFHAGVPAGWVAIGTWTQVGDDVMSTSTANTGSRLSLLVPMPNGKTTVSGSATVLGTPGPLSLVAVVDNHAVGSLSSIFCGLGRQDPDPSPILVVADSGAFSTVNSAGYEMTNNATYTLRQTRNATAYACRAERGATSATVNGTFSVNNSTPGFGLITFNASARFQWTMLVKSP